MIDKFKVTGSLFAVGAVGYSLLEIVWRGFTHWTMAVTGGVCFTAVYFLNQRYKKQPLGDRCLMCAGIITGIEFLVGCMVNLVLRWNVWDYSDRFMNLLGQICPLYTFLWFLLSLPLCKLSELLSRRLPA